MIAEVYPLRRLSRTMRFFDYEVSERFCLSRGSFVEIPLRSQTAMGIVRRLKDVPPRGIRLKPILSVLALSPLKDEELSFFEEVAHSIVQPTANVLFNSFPLPSPIRTNNKPNDWRAIPLTIPASESTIVSRLAKQMTERRRAFVQVPDLRRAAAVLTHYFNQRPPEKRLILCPHVEDARLLTRAMYPFAPLFVTGEEAPSERFQAWQTFRQSSDALLITTRAGLLYADSQTACICILRSGHPDHVQRDRNPRLDSRRLMDAFADRFVANLFFLDVCARADDLWRFDEENILSYPPHLPVFIDASQERPVSEHAVISASGEAVIRENIEKNQRVLIVYNKKGYAMRLRCQDCEHRFVCAKCGHAIGVNKQTVFCIHCGLVEPIPIKCPTCRSTRIQLRGFGSERLAETLRSWFPNETITLIDKEHPKSSTASLVLATRYYLENLFDPLRPESFGALILLDPDTPLFTPSFQSSERALWALSEWLGVARATGATAYVQTEEKELFENALLNPIPHLHEELRSRKSFDQPPFARWFSVTIREKEQKKRELEEHLLSEALKKIPGVSVIQDLRLCIPEQCVEDVLQLFSTLDDRYIIDTNVFS